MKRVNQKGIALIQVLIISIILAMLGIYISQTVRSQIHSAGVMKQSQQAIADLESAEAELLHYLATESRYPSKTDEGIRARWNFYGKPFLINEHVIATIQDVSSLLSINHVNRRLAENLFYRLGKENEPVRIFLDSLADWKDKDDLTHLNGAESSYYEKTLGYGPRNSYLQSFAEISHIKQGDLLTNHQWKQYFSLSLGTSFNPLNAPEHLLSAYLDDVQAFQQVVELRENKELNGFAFFQATGIDEDDFISFRTGRVFNIKLETANNENYLNKSMTVEVRANSKKRPILMTNITWNNS
ncbi:general secretion pathway protein GspK [Thalassotalea atypica]|uniref:general secretion pathway protein GspK n=1 Tax=Thalassotalea atypica TaxID=2054316 RepID=UPI002574546D|nr:type II secretion system protein GspK [Thalassotalea atypica]